MNKIKIVFFVILLTSFWVVSCSSAGSSEISADYAIHITRELAKNNNYDTSNVDIEILKVKNGPERGPIRLVWLINYIPKDEFQALTGSEFWVVYFYPKGALERPGRLGGGFCALIELYSGKVLFSFEDQ